MSVTGKETQHQKGRNSAKDGFEQQCYTCRLYNDRSLYPQASLGGKVHLPRNNWSSFGPHLKERKGENM